MGFDVDLEHLPALVAGVKRQDVASVRIEAGWSRLPPGGWLDAKHESYATGSTPKFNVTCVPPEQTRHRQAQKKPARSGPLQFLQAKH